MNVRLIDEEEPFARLCERVANAERVALDTEFHNERSYSARLMVVQLAIDDEVALVDPLRLQALQPLADALASRTVVGHALQSDLKIFADRFGRLPARAFDTQLAAAFSGYGMSISLADLVQNVAGVRLRKSQTISDWSVRPLSPQQIEYLVDDVRHLFALQDRLTEVLEESGRLPWFEEEARTLVDPQRYAVDPERLYLRISGAMRMNRRELGILREIAVLRDRLARERDVPLKYIIPDDVMAAIVHLRPAVREDLAQLRRLDAGARKIYGDRIVEGVQRGLALPDSELPRKPVRPPGSDREAIVACLSVLVNAIAAENDLPPSLLLPRAALERIARELPQTPEKLALLAAADEDAPSGTGWRAALISEPLHALLHGRTALAIGGVAKGSPRVERVERLPAALVE
jgi:ribonuclease D